MEWIMCQHHHVYTGSMFNVSVPGPYWTIFVERTFRVSSMTSLD